jgi:3-keto-5-aminohexanoate cleavage enzyme
MSYKPWLEVAVNGPWSRRLQPLIPITVDEIVADGVAAAGEGAAIIHVHAYDEQSGRQRDDWQIYARIIEGIRKECDALIYPSFPFAAFDGSVADDGGLGINERFDAVEQLAKRGLIDFCTCDPGSTNIVSDADVAAGRPGFVYANPESHINHALDLAERHRIPPNGTIYEPGFLRLGSAHLKRHPGVPTPVWRIMFSDHFCFGFPPEEWALEAYHHLLQREAPQVHWMVAGLNVNTLPLFELAMERGGHLRVGLEDAPHGTEHGNLELTRTAVAAIRATGREPATPAEVRTALGQ